MADYSNRTIVALLAVALVITVVGTLVSVSKLNELGGTYTYLTGAATSTSTGQTNITITSTTSLTLANTNINFGSGRLNGSAKACAIDTNNSVLNIWSNGTTSGGNFVNDDRTGCVSFTGPTSGFLLENTGNNNVSVGYTCSGNCTRLLFTGSGLGGAISWGYTNGLDIKISAQSKRKQSGESGVVDANPSCAGGGTFYRDSGWNITNGTAYTQSSQGNLVASEQTYLPLSTQGQWLCGNYTASPLLPDNSKDAAVLDINVTIDDSAVGTGVQSSFTLTFNATSQ